MRFKILKKINGRKVTKEDKEKLNRIKKKLETLNYTLIDDEIIPSGMSDNKFILMQLFDGGN